MIYNVEFADLRMVYLDYQSVEGYEYRNLSYADMVELVEYVEAMGYDFHDVAYVWEVAA
jgi:hypothetical protein